MDVGKVELADELFFGVLVIEGELGVGAEDEFGEHLAGARVCEEEVEGDEELEVEVGVVGGLELAGGVVEEVLDVDFLEIYSGLGIRCGSCP